MVARSEAREMEEWEYEEDEKYAAIDLVVDFTAQMGLKYLRIREDV